MIAAQTALPEAAPNPAEMSIDLDLDTLDDVPRIGGPSEADELIVHVTETMDAMSAVIESETRLVRAAKLREAMRLHEDKQRLVLRYKTAVRALKVNGPAMRAMVPERMERLSQRHDAFAKAVSANLETLKTARDVSENLVRAVSTELHEAHANTPYSDTGYVDASPKSTPLSVDKPV